MGEGGGRTDGSTLKTMFIFCVLICIFNFFLLMFFLYFRIIGPVCLLFSHQFSPAVRAYFTSYLQPSILSWDEFAMYNVQVPTRFSLYTPYILASQGESALPDHVGFRHTLFPFLAPTFWRPEFRVYQETTLFSSLESRTRVLLP